MIKKIIISLIILIPILLCAQVFAGNQTVDLFDLSGSVLTDNSGKESKDSPYNKNMAESRKEINKLGKGDSITILGFGRKSDVVLLKAVMPKQAGSMNRNLIATREAAIKRFEENIATKTTSVDRSKTDVIGGIYRASRLFEEMITNNSDRRLLFIFSDMLDTENLGMSINRLKIPGSHREFLNRLESKKIGYPDLKTVEINLFSAFSDIKGINTVETEIALRELKGFWTEFFKRSGGIIKSYRTSY